MTLRELQPGKTATILSVGGEGALRQHLLDMGLIQGTEVTVVKYAPMGDPVELRIHGYELTIRLDDADKIMISKPHEAKWHPECKPFKDPEAHPGYGEGGKYHNKEEEHELDRQIICSGKAYLGRVSGTALCKGAGRRDTARGQIPFLYGAGLSLSFAVCEGICDGRGENRGRGTDDTLLLYGA